jgi:23S rRNA (cytosine1962-C5)-methyltransferase
MNDQTPTESPVSSPPRALSALPVGRAVLKPRKARPFYGRHPWVLDSAVARVEGDVRDGDVVDLLSDKGKFVARGVYNSNSRIRVRLYTWNPADRLDRDFWRRRLAAAIELRTQLGYDEPAGAARLVFSEADGLSGLIVDRYADYLSVQAGALAMAARLDELTELLVELVQPRGVFVRGERGVPAAEGVELSDGLYWGESPEGPVFIEENGLRFGVDLAEGHKTGFYLDQRENRRVAAGYMRRRRVLDLCVYSGGFSIAASKLGGAREVLAVDTSAKALALARANAELNGATNIQFEEGNVFQVVDDLAGRRERFGGVILDPPKFARGRRGVDDALRAYHRLNRMAVELLEPGGILVTNSCSGHVTREDFLYMLVGVSQQTGRDIQILEQRGAAADHPVAVTCLENEYLKCFICRVV